MGIQLPDHLHSVSSYGRLQVKRAMSGHNIEVNVFNMSLAMLLVFVVSRLVKLLNGLQAVNYLPGLRVPFQPLAPPGAALPRSSWNPSIDFHWFWRFNFYNKYHSENVSVIPFIYGTTCIYTSNLDVARQVVAGGHKSSFIKPETASEGILLWGMNLVASEGEMWRKHRRVMGPAFNNKLYQMVWKQTLHTYHEMTTVEGWTDKDVVDVPVIQTLTFKLALLVLGACGFGFPFTWSTPPTGPDGSMSVQEALRIVADSTIFAITAPKWLWKVPIPRIKKIRAAHDQLTEFMRTQVAERKLEIRSHLNDESFGRLNDAFSMLVKANEQDSGKLRLDDEELVGNVFIMLFAGHETTAHSLAATLGFIGLHDDIQNEVLEQIVSVVGYDRDPVFEDYPKLDKVLAVFYEALRMFPAAHVLIREATEDTILNFPNPLGQEGSKAVPIPKGVQVIVDMVGVQYNPRYFDEPEKYKPSRWYGVSGESDAFTAFSVGPRVCIGRKFTTTEAVCFLTMLLRDWKVEPILREGETKEAWRKRVLEGKVVITLGVLDVPMRFTRRKR